MPDEYISREAVNGLLYRMKIDRPLDSDRWVLSAVERGVEEIPAADVVEVRHGEWIPEPDRHYRWHCSECGYVIGVARMDCDFCPKCGAKMDGGADNG